MPEGWGIRAPNKGSMAISPDAMTLAEYHDVNRSLLEFALHTVEAGLHARQDVLTRIDVICGKLNSFESDDESLATFIEQLFSAIAALAGYGIATQIVERCNEHLYFSRTRECQYLDDVLAELAGLCELAAGSHFAELKQAITEYHTRRNRLSSS